MSSASSGCAVIAVVSILALGCQRPSADPTAVAERAPVDPATARYFPPADGTWARSDPAEAGWDAARLEAALDLAGERDSTGVVVLHGGRIMAERYWELSEPSRGYTNGLHGTDADGHAIEDVASTQKSVVAVLTGLAQHRGLLSLDDPVSAHLNEGWSLAPPEHERAITIRHLISMTTGLTPALEYEAEPGTTWFYNTPAYHHVLRIIAKAANQDRNDVTREWLTERIGMHDSSWEPRPWANAAIGVGFATTARDLARFGLLILADGVWNGTVIIEDTRYLAQMLRPSQRMNPSYGFLWWVNGQASSMSWAVTPERTEGALIASAPADLVAAQGARDRKLYVVPSLDLVVTRLGDVGSVAGSSFNDAFWERLIQAAPPRPTTE